MDEKTLQIIPKLNTDKIGNARNAFQQRSRPTCGATRIEIMWSGWHFLSQSVSSTQSQRIEKFGELVQQIAKDKHWIAGRSSVGSNNMLICEKLIGCEIGGRSYLISFYVLKASLDFYKLRYYWNFLGCHWWTWLKYLLWAQSQHWRWCHMPIQPEYYQTWLWGPLAMAIICSSKCHKNNVVLSLWVKQYPFYQDCFITAESQSKRSRLCEGTSPVCSRIVLRLLRPELAVQQSLVVGTLSLS